MINLIKIIYKKNKYIIILLLLNEDKFILLNFLKWDYIPLILLTLYILNDDIFNLINFTQP